MPKPDFEKLNSVMGEAYDLARAGTLTLEKLEELERQAEQAAGEGYDNWRGSMDRYRDQLEAFAGRDPDDNS